MPGYQEVPMEVQSVQPQNWDSMSSASLQRLLQISTRLSSTLHLEELLSLVMEVATELTDTEVASILLVDQKTGQLHFAASTGGGISKDIAVPLDNSIAGWVVRHGRSVILGDVQADSRFYANVDEEVNFVTRSMLAVPMITNKSVIGALEVINKRNNTPYTGQDVALMEALASQSAVAIVNAHLFNQSDLLAEIMHEIKTPLMAITAASELLSRPNLPADKHSQVVQMIQRESKRVSQMTRDFLDYARLESRRARLSRHPVDVAVLVNDVVSLVQSQAATRHIILIPDIQPELLTPTPTTPILMGDGDRLKQVLLNLVSNGIKYNYEHGSITIKARINNETDLCLSVTDTGPGIGAEDLKHLGERFYRVPGSESKSEGSGLGLAIAQKIVQEHSGRIEITSTLGQGTTFTIILPVLREQ